MPARHRCDPVPARLGARDAAVAVVVVAPERIAVAVAARPCRRRHGRCRGRRRLRGRALVGEHHGGAAAAAQHAAGGVGLGLVHREIVLALHLHDLVHVPALVQRRQPLRQVLVDLLVPVHAGAGQGEVEQVAGEGAFGVAVPAAQAAVVRLAAGDDVLDVGVSDAGEVGAGVRAVDAPALLVDDMRLDTLRIGIVVRIIVRAAIFRPDRDACQAVAAAPAVAAAGRRAGRRRVGGRRRDVLRDRHGRPGDAQIQERRVDPTALLVHAAELDPGGVEAVAAVAGDDVEALALGDGADDREVVAGPCAHIDARAADNEIGVRRRGGGGRRARGQTRGRARRPSCRRAGRRRRACGRAARLDGLGAAGGRAGAGGHARPGRYAGARVRGGRTEERCGGVDRCRRGCGRGCGRAGRLRCLRTARGRAGPGRLLKPLHARRQLIDLRRQGVKLEVEPDEKDQYSGDRDEEEKTEDETEKSLH